MFAGLLDYLEHRKRLRDERRVRQERRSKYSWFECTAARLREYPRTLELVQSAKDEGATHCEWFHSDLEIDFYRMYGYTPQWCMIQYAFTDRAVKTPWRDMDERTPEETRRLEKAIQSLEKAIARGEEPFASNAARELQRLTTPPVIPSRAWSIDELFESDPSSDRADY